MLSYVNGPLKCDGPLNCWLIFGVVAHSLLPYLFLTKRILYCRVAHFIRVNDKFDFLCYSFQLDFCTHKLTLTGKFAPPSHGHHSELRVSYLCVCSSFICQFMRALKFPDFSSRKTKSSAFNWVLDLSSVSPRSRNLLTRFTTFIQHQKRFRLTHTQAHNIRARAQLHS